MDCLYVILLLILIILVLLFFHLYLWPKLRRKAKAEEEDAQQRSQVAAPEEKNIEPADKVDSAARNACPVVAAVSEPARDDTASIAPGHSAYVKISDDAADLFARGRKCFVAVDINTIGMLGKLTPIEVSAVRFIEGKEAEHYSSYICPKRREDGTLALVVDVDPDELERSPKECEVFTALNDFLSDDLLAAHNASFDARLLVEACNRCGLTKEYQFFDTLVMARELFPDLENHKLPTVVEYMKTSQPSTFRSYNDCTAVAAILNAYFALRHS